LSHPGEVAEILALIAGNAAFIAQTVAVGKGLYLAWRRTAYRTETSCRA
jgi:hypothetical protein